VFADHRALGMRQRRLQPGFIEQRNPGTGKETQKADWLAPAGFGKPGERRRGLRITDNEQQFHSGSPVFIQFTRAG
jgi:hypothetical protein